MLTQEKRKFGAVFGLRCYDSQGNLKWVANATNIVTEAGLDYMLGSALGGEAQTTTFYAGLTDGSPTVDESDTLDSADWSEVTAYNGDRKEWVSGSASGKQIDNSGDLATFEATSDGVTVGGAFLTAAQTGTSGLLLNVAPLEGGDRTVSTGDTIELEVRFNASNN